MSAGTNLDMDYATLCYDPGGTNLWTSRYNYAGGDDRAGGLEVAPTGEIVVVGISMDSTGNNQYAYLQYDESDGSTLIEERKNLPGIALEKPAAIAQDNYGNFYITGSVSDGTHYDMYTAKLDDSLQIDWEVTYNGDSLNDEPNAIGVDTAGNVFVTGYTEDDNGKQFVTIKYDSAGEVDWVQIESSGSGTGSAEATDLQITLDDKIYVTGSRSVGSTNSVYTVCYNQEGEKVWQQFTDEEEEAEDVQADLYGNVFVTGRSFANGNYAYLALKYSTYHHVWQVERDTANNPTHLGNEVIVRFDPSALILTQINNPKIQFGRVDQFVKPAILSQMETKLGTNGQLANSPVIKIFRNLTSNHTTSISRGGNSVPIPSLWAALLIKLPETGNESVEDNAPEAIDSLNTMKPDIWYAHYNRLGSLTQGANDPYYADTFQTSLNVYPNDLVSTDTVSIRVESAWDKTTGRPEVRVGVFDSGIEWTHPDFGGDGITMNSSVIKGGFNLFSSVPISNLPNNDTTGHGTSVAGIIGAVRNDSFGIAGIAGGDDLIGLRGVSLFAMKIGNANGQIPLSMVCAALEAGARDTASGGLGLHIMNHSWGYSFLQPATPPYVRMLGEAVEFALKNEVTTVASSGNHSTLFSNAFYSYPGMLFDEWVVCVGGTGTNGRYLGENNGKPGDWPSNSNTLIDVAAPATLGLVITTHKGAGYRYFNGTSAAAPHVSGTVGLMLSYFNDFTSGSKYLAPADVEHILQRTATDKGAPGHDSYTGYGLLYAGAALTQISYPYDIQHFETTNFHTDTLFTDTLIEINHPYQHFPVGNFRVDIIQFKDTISANIGNALVVDYWTRPSTSSAWNFVSLGTDVIPVDRPQLQRIGASGSEFEVTGYYFYVHEDNFGTSIQQNFPLEIVDSFPPKISISILTYDPSVAIASDKDYPIDWTIFPNPTDKEVFIQLPQSQSSSVQYALFDVTGRKAYEQNIAFRSSGTYRDRLSLSHLPAGLYYLRASSNHFSVSKQLVIH